MDAIQCFNSHESNFFLDSQSNPGGKLDYLVFGKPKMKLIQWHDRLEIIENDENEKRELKNENIFDFISGYLSKNKSDSNQLFSGGFAGYIPYDYAWKIESLQMAKPFSKAIPLAEFHLFEDYAISENGKQTIVGKMNKRKRKFMEKTQMQKTQVKTAYPKNEFESIIKKAREYIKKGDIYQANLSQRFETTVTNPFQTYLNLRAANPSPYSGYFAGNNFTLVCNSPERLFCKRGDVISTRPIAGTRKPGEQQKLNLRRSVKENAEHIMLVDLERNDLGKLAKEIEVDELMSVEKYSHVQHLVTNIRGVAREGIGAKEIVHAMFPGGTITGCPKVRAMEIIDELEPYRRGLYTGSLGYFSLNGNVDLNIIIRSPIFIGGKAYLHAGAGIVYDSQWEREYNEILSKAQAMMQAVV